MDLPLTAEHWDGNTWQESITAPVGFPHGLTAISPTNVWVVGDFGISHWDGMTWTSSDAGSDAFGNIWWDGKQIWAVAAGGIIRHP
jgi:hypothetical protein